MPTIKISTFNGMVPALDDRLLPDNNSAFARNVWLYSGALQGYREFREVHTLTNAKTCSVFRIPNNFPDGEHISDSTWMEFPGAFVDVIRTAVVDDKYERYYWAQQTVAPYYNTKARIKAGLPPWRLGVPAPGFQLSLSSTVANTDQSLTETRSYVVTWVTEYGEEGPPCSPVTATGSASAVWTLSGLVPPTDTERNIKTARIYRTVTSSQGVATYFFVAEVGTTVSTYSDAAKSSAITANNQLQSATWFPPPDDLEGWVTMPNGIIAGWRGKEVWFSEQYRPHAWPSEYTVATEYEIVGLGVVGQTLVVCTQGYPTAITGINPASMSMAKVASFEPCTARGSILSTPEGVYYASPNGLIRASNGAFVNITDKFITKDKWRNLIRLNTLQAARLGTGYYVFGVTAYKAFDSAFDASGFDTTDDLDGAHAGLFIDPSNPEAITTLCSDSTVQKVQNDPWSGELLMVKDGKVFWVDVASQTLPRTPYVWRSKIFQANKVDNFEAMKVYFDESLT